MCLQPKASVDMRGKNFRRFCHPDKSFQNGPNDSWWPLFLLRFAATRYALSRTECVDFFIGKIAAALLHGPTTISPFVHTAHTHQTRLKHFIYTHSPSVRNAFLPFPFTFRHPTSYSRTAPIIESCLAHLTPPSTIHSSACSCMFAHTRLPPGVALRPRFPPIQIHAG